MRREGRGVSLEYRCHKEFRMTVEGTRLARKEAVGWAKNYLLDQFFFSAKILLSPRYTRQEPVGKDWRNECHGILRKPYRISRISMHVIERVAREVGY